MLDRERVIAAVYAAKRPHAPIEEQGDARYVWPGALREMPLGCNSRVKPPVSECALKEASQRHPSFVWAADLRRLANNEAAFPERAFGRLPKLGLNLPKHVGSNGRSNLLRCPAESWIGNFPIDLVLNLVGQHG